VGTAVDGFVTALNRFLALALGINASVKMQKVIRKRIRRNDGGINLVGDINAVVAANVNERGSSSASVSSRQQIVQTTGRARRKTEEEHDGRERPR
jgi:hypothetical protein